MHYSCTGFQARNGRLIENFRLNFNLNIIYNQSSPGIIFISFTVLYEIHLFRIKIEYTDIKILRFAYLFLLTYFCIDNIKKEEQ